MNSSFVDFVRRSRTVAFARANGDRDLVLREVLHDLTQCGHAVKSMSAIATASMTTCSVSGNFANCSCISRRKMPRCEEQFLPKSTARMWSTRSTPSSSSGSQLVSRRRPTQSSLGRAIATSIEDRQSTAIPTCSTPMKITPRAETARRQLQSARRENLAELADFDESAGDEPEHAANAPRDHVRELGERRETRAPSPATSRTSFVRPPAQFRHRGSRRAGVDRKAPTSRTRRSPARHHEVRLMLSRCRARRRWCDWSRHLAQDHDHRGERGRADRPHSTAQPVQAQIGSRRSRCQLLHT